MFVYIYTSIMYDSRCAIKHFDNIYYTFIHGIFIYSCTYLEKRHKMNVKKKSRNVFCVGTTRRLCDYLCVWYTLCVLSILLQYDRNNTYLKCTVSYQHQSIFFTINTSSYFFKLKLLYFFFHWNRLFFLLTCPLIDGSYCHWQYDAI